MAQYTAKMYPMILENIQMWEFLCLKQGNMAARAVSDFHFKIKRTCLKFYFHLV